MRLWHYILIPVLPRQQLLGQWRECCLIAKNIREKGTPNHILVNPIMDYPINEFLAYWLMVGNEIEKRGYRIDEKKLVQYRVDGMSIAEAYSYYISEDNLVQSRFPLFPRWHTEKYLTQCLANLEEKHDRGGITNEEWNRILRYLSTLKRNERRRAI